MSEHRPTPARGQPSGRDAPHPAAQAQAAQAAQAQPQQPPVNPAAAAARAAAQQQAGAVGRAGPAPRFAPLAPNPSDMVYHFWMPWGIEGDVNRVRPWSILPMAVDPATQPIYFGRAIVKDATTQRARLVQAGDAPEDVWGISVRPYPFQSTWGFYGPGYGDYGSVGFGAGVQPMHATLDVLEWGYIFVRIWGDPPGATTGGQHPVEVYTGPDVPDPANPGSFLHVQGGFEVGGDLALPQATTRYNGQRGAIAELRFNI